MTKKAMTKKHYELIASVLKSAFDYYGKDEMVVLRIAQSMAGTLAAFDERFDRDKFLKDCGVEQPRYLVDGRKGHYDANGNEVLED